MLEDTDFNFDSHNTIELIHRYESTLQIQERAYFDVDQFEEIIDHYIESGNTGMATETVNSALSVHPYSTGLKLRLAQVEIDNDHFNEALQLLNSLEKLEPNNHDILLLKGTAFLFSNDLQQAEKEFTAALNLVVDDKTETNYIIGFQYCQSENYQLAIEYLRKAQTKNKHHVQALFELGYCLERTGKIEESIKIYLQYLDLDAFSDSAWFNLGTLYGRINNHKEAVEAFEYTLALNPNFSAAIFNKANALACIENFEQAALTFEEYLEGEPDQYEAYCYLAECYEKLGRLEDAKNNYQTAILIDPDYTDAWHGLGVIQSMLGFQTESMESLNKALALDGENSNIWYSIGKVYIKLNQIDDALLALNQSIELEKSNHDSWLSIADLYYKNNNLPEAINTLFKAIKLNKAIAPLNFRLAGYLALSGKQTEALNYLDKGLRINYYDYCEFLKVFPNGLEIESFGILVNQYKPKQ